MQFCIPIQSTRETLPDKSIALPVTCSFASYAEIVAGGCEDSVERRPRCFADLERGYGINEVYFERPVTEDWKKLEIPMDDAVLVQREYYRATAGQYDSIHADAIGEHDFALAFMLSMVGFLGVRSVLDIGSGTGRGVLQVKASYPDLKVIGVEPSEALRQVGHSKGLRPEELIDGDAQRLEFADGEFDLVCEFGALHHMPDPRKAVGEMLRVARKAIFISDGNNFGQGGLAGRTVKQLLHALHLWKAADLIKTRGKGYAISEGDGLYYSYSVFDDYPQIAKACKSVHLMNSTGAGMNLYRTATHIALLGIK